MSKASNVDSFFVAAEFVKSFFEKNKIKAPDIHVVLGTGFGSAVDDLMQGKSKNFEDHWEYLCELSFKDIPGMHPATVVGHKGIQKFFKNKKTNKSVCFQIGRIHGYEGHDPKEVVLPLVASYLAGTKEFVLTNAAGSLNTHFDVGSVMMIADHCNMTGKNPLIGPNWVGPKGLMGPRFPDMTHTYNKEATQQIEGCLKKQGIVVNKGTYLGLMGPTFETPAEVRLYASWKLDAVGMSTVWEAIVLNYLGAKVSGLSLMSNMACGLSDKILDHEALLDESRKAALGIVQGLFDYAGL